MPRTANSADESIREEQRDIRRRRKVHQSPDSTDSSADRSSPRIDDLTGLALSGGGIRSAAFSLGFIQAMYRTGRMKAFDYLSTVSGGGYAGAMFSSVVARETNKINWDRNGRFNRLDIEPPAEGGQPDSVERLALHGRMMGNFLRLFSRHLWGFLINVTFVVSGLFAIAAVLAYVMRIPWSPTMGMILSELEFRSDLTVPFFFTFIALLIWLMSHLIARVAKLVGKQLAPFSQYSYLLLLATAVLGLLTMLAIGDIDIGKFLAGNGSNEHVQESINQVVRWLGVGISAVFVTSLLPYLTPKRLLQSGDPGAGRVQSLIFRGAGNALIIGAPLFVFFLLVHENISGWNSSRPNADQLTASHLGSTPNFAAQLESQATSKIEPRKQLARRIYLALNGIDESDVPVDEFGVPDWKRVEVRNELKQLQAVGDELRISNEKFGFGSRCLQWLADAIRIDDQFGRRLEVAKGSRLKQNKIVERFNERILSDPTLFVSLANETNPAGTTVSIKVAAATNEMDEATAAGDTQATAVPLETGDAAATSETQEAAAADFRQVAVVTERTDETSVPPDRAETLLKAFGLPTSKPKSSDDDKLERAFESLRTANNQLDTRFREITINAPEQGPKKVSADGGHLTFALVGLACDDLQRDRIQEGSKLTIKPQQLDGRFVTRMDRLLEDEDGTLQSRIENQLGELRASTDPEDIGNFDSRFDAWKTKQALVVGDLSQQVREGNWQLLQAIYPKFIRPQDTVFARVVNEADQAYRLKIAAYAAIIFLLVGLLSNLNGTSLHGVYRDQLAEIWLPDPNIRLHELDTCSRGAPYHLINGTVNRMGHRNDPDIEGRSRFLFSHRFCGTKKIGYRETKEYENGAITVADAMAISGGAVTSVNAPSSLQQLILFLTNFRLGHWVPSPLTYEKDYYWPSPIRTVLNLLWHPEQRRFLFISDGGHTDNTGLASLFERRCRLMVCADASQDSKYEFTDFLKVVHSARAKYGVRIEPVQSSFEPADALDALRPGERDRSPAHFVTFTVHYPGETKPAVLVYCKLTLTGDEPLELVERARANGAFPHDPTSDQFLPANIFESYLALGRHIGEKVDEFVRDGGLDSFGIGQGWSSEQGDESLRTDIQTEIVEAAVSADSSKETTCTLEEAEFNESGVQQSIEILDRWCLQQLSRDDHPDHSIDTSELEIVSSWAREEGMDASLTLRRHFCAAIIGQAGEYGVAIKSDPTSRLHYCMMLETLGDRVPGARKTLKELSRSDAST